MTKKLGKLSLFLAAYGLTSADIDKVYTDPRVALELAQEPLDGRGVYDAVYSAVLINSFTECAQEMREPLGQLTFLNVVDAL